MNTHDIELPPLPSPTHRGYGLHYNADEMESYAIAAIEADRKHFAELFMDLSRYAAGMYEQDHDPQMEGVSDGYWYAAEFLLGNKDAVNDLDADRKRRGEPVDIRQEVIETLEMILAADWRKWEELASPDEFVRWAKSRANYALSIINEAPQPAAPSQCTWENVHPDCAARKHTEPMKFPSDKEILEMALACSNKNLSKYVSIDFLERFTREILERYGQKK